MNFPTIHFLREILAVDARGKLVPMMQSSDSNTDALHPVYLNAAFYEHTALRALYTKLGGARRDNESMGSTVVIPNRSGWASLRSITAGEVTILPRPDAPSADDLADRKTQTRARDRLARD